MLRSRTLNRFPLLGLFAHQAARHIGYSEDDARLLGYSTALLYAIYSTRHYRGDKQGTRQVNARATEDGRDFLQRQPNLGSVWRGSLGVGAASDGGSRHNPCGGQVSQPRPPSLSS